MPNNSLYSVDRWAVAETAAPFTIPLTEFRTHNDMAVNLPAAAADDDMGLVTGTPGTHAPTLQGVDFGGTTSDEEGTFHFSLPNSYIAGAAVTVRVRAGMLTTVSDGTATLDCEAYLDDEDGTVSSDSCATAAQSINSVALADYDFVLTTTYYSPGETVVINLTFAGSDTGNAGVMACLITKVQVLCDLRA